MVLRCRQKHLLQVVLGSGLLFETPSVRPVPRGQTRGQYTHQSTKGMELEDALVPQKVLQPLPLESIAEFLKVVQLCLDRPLHQNSLSIKLATVPAPMELGSKSCKDKNLAQKVVEQLQLSPARPGGSLRSGCFRGVMA